MAQIVNPQDIVANQKKVEQMQKDFADMLKMRENVLKSFDTKLRSLEGSVKTMKEAIDSGKDRVYYQQRLQKEIEMRIDGKRMASLAPDDDRRIVEYINVVAKKDFPDFSKAAGGFVHALGEIQKSLK